MKFKIEKHMRLHLLLILIFTISLTSCKDDDLGAFTPKTPELNIETNSLEIPKDGGEYEIKLKSNLPWRVVSDVNWIVVQNGYGMADGSFKIAVETNPTIKSRSGKLTVWITKDAIKEIIITQEEGELPPVVSLNYFVKKSGQAENDGLSWENATTLDNALSMAVSGDVIHVAAGTYFPEKIITGGKSADEKDKTFEINKNIKIVGGYANNSITGAKPDYKSNPTILSGNLTTGKVYHTMSITAPMEEDRKVHIQGIIIKDGEASDVSSYVTINGVKFQRNYAGGLVIGRSNAVLEDCAITNNSSLAFAAGISIIDASMVTFNRCQITNNSGTSNGGALWNDNSTVYLVDCNVSNNSTITGVAAGIYGFNAAGGTSTTYMFNTTISNNKSGAHSAGYYGRVGSVGIMVNCTVFGNTAGVAGDGGAINLHGGGVLDVISSTITANSARTGGGIRCQANSTINLINSIVSGNLATNEGNDISTVGTSSYSQSIVTTKTYDAQGGENLAAPAFDFTTMLSSLADNGGFTQTCALAGENNPAVTLGMSSSQLETKAGLYNPQLPTSIISLDQTGKPRSGKTCMGSIVK